MGRSQMRERWRVFTYSAPTVTGVPTDTYTMVPSGAPDGAFDAAFGMPSGHETTTAAARDRRADGVVTFPDDTPLEENGLLRRLLDMRLYKIVGPIHYAHRRGVFRVIAEHSNLANDKTVKIVGEP